ncbi:MAG TPA: phosphotransferase [Actinomycetes bacterium]|nr:phosphotransferase [Actinomycetes bacterium]
MSLLGFDPVLDRLPVIADPDATAALFADQLGPGVRVLRRQDTKYRPRSRCVAVFELAADGQEPGARTFGVVTVTPEGAGARLMDADPDLPALAEALDPGRMAARFATALPGVEACEATAVRYKPGARCVVRYRLRTGTGTVELYGKLLGDGLDQQLATVGELVAAGGRDPAMPGVLPVTAAWPDLGLLVQPAVERAAELNDRAFDPDVPERRRERWLEGAGRCLAALHGCALPAAPLRRHGGDLDELRGYLGPLRQADPDLAGRFEAVLDALGGPGRPDRDAGDDHGARDARDAGDAEDPPTGGHGAFRTDQFLIDGERLVLIDLDTACRAEPARDLGNLLAYLDWKAIRRPAAAGMTARAGESFLAGYARGREPPARRRVERHRAASLLKIAGRRYRSLTVNEWPLVPQLVERAAVLADAGTLA